MEPQAVTLTCLWWQGWAGLGRAGQGWAGQGRAGQKIWQLTIEKASATALEAVSDTLVKDWELELDTAVTLPTGQQNLSVSGHGTTYVLFTDCKVTSRISKTLTGQHNTNTHKHVNVAGLGVT